MKLYYAPSACSLASRISIHEAGLAADFEKVDLKAKITEHGDDYRAINPKGYVPMLVLDDGQGISENVAILDHLVERDPKLGPEGPLARTRLLEMLAYLSAELHVAFKPFFRSGSEAEKAEAAKTIAERLGFLEGEMAGPYLFGPRFTVADAYLFVQLRWARRFDLPLSPRLADYFERVLGRESVRQAMSEEGLVEEPLAALA